MAISKRFQFLCGAGALLSIVSQPVLADEIRFYNWESYLSSEFITQFEAETGHHVNEIFYDEEDVRDAVITSGRGDNYDVILVDAFSLMSLQDGDNFHNLSQLEFSNRRFIGEKWQQACGQYGIPYAHGTLGIAYRDSINKTPITSWNQLLNPPLEHVGRVAMLFDAMDTVAVALLAAGYSAFSEDEKELKIAYDKLIAQKPNVATYEYGVSYAITHGADSQLSMAMVYSTDMWSLSEYTGQDDWQYVIPKEGTAEWVDCLVLPVSHPIAEATVQFLDYLNDPRIAIENAESVWITTTNEGALALASDDYLADSALFPPSDVMEKSESYRAMSTQGLNFRKRMLVGIANYK